jgi:hypothetical protein
MLEEYKIVECHALKDYKLSLTFADGKVGVADVSHLVGKGVFTLWQDYNEFENVTIDSKAKTVCWNNEIDLDPVTLRNNLS